MGTVVIKDSIKMAVRDRNQLAAFLNNGWILDGPSDDATKNFEETNAGSSEEAVQDDSEVSDKQYSKSEIQHMSTADLKALAAEIGIEVTEESTGKALKEEIIAKLGL